MSSGNQWRSNGNKSFQIVGNFLSICARSRFSENLKNGLLSLFNGISTFVGYLMPKSSYLTDRGDKRVHIFPKSIYPKVDVIARLEFELVYF